MQYFLVQLSWKIIELGFKIRDRHIKRCFGLFGKIKEFASCLLLFFIDVSDVQFKVFCNGLDFDNLSVGLNVKSLPVRVHQGCRILLVLHLRIHLLQLYLLVFLHSDELRLAVFEPFQVVDLLLMLFYPRVNRRE